MKVIEYEEWLDGYMNNPIADEEGLCSHLKRAWNAGKLHENKALKERLEALKDSKAELLKIVLSLQKTIRKLEARRKKRNESTEH